MAANILPVCACDHKRYSHTLTIQKKKKALNLVVVVVVVGVWRGCVKCERPWPFGHPRTIARTHSHAKTNTHSRGPMQNAF